MKDDTQRKSYTFSIEAYMDFVCVGMTMLQSENLPVDVPLTEKEVETIKLLVNKYTLGSNADLMPVLKDNAPELYERINKAARKAILDRVRQKEVEIMAIYRGDEPGDDEPIIGEEDVEDIPYDCHIPNL